MEHLPELNWNEVAWRREWRRFLPSDYARRVAVPVRFALARDRAAGGARVWGYDRWGEACFYHQVFECRAPQGLDEEDGELFEEARSYGQSRMAWRLGGQWLVCTREHGAACACAPEYRHYTLSKGLPR